MSLTIEQFFAELDTHPESIPLGELVDLMKRLEVSLDDIAAHLHFSDDCYQRNLWHCGHGYAAIILCWAPGQDSPIHDHKGSSCGVRVLQGEVTETIYLTNDDGSMREHKTNVYQTGLVCGSHDTDIHMIGNRHPDDMPLVTLHIYTPPLSGYRVYQMDGSYEICVDSTLARQREMLSSAI